MNSLSANAEESSAATEEIASASSLIMEMVENLRRKIGEFSV
jgi:methyl-accepting chemotaxis protein